MPTPIQPTIGLTRASAEREAAMQPVHQIGHRCADAFTRTKHLQRYGIDEDLRRDGPFAFTAAACDAHGRRIAGDERHD